MFDFEEGMDYWSEDTFLLPISYSGVDPNERTLWAEYCFGCDLYER